MTNYLDLDFDTRTAVTAPVKDTKKIRRRIAAAKHKTSGRTLGSTLGNTIGGKNPWSLPSDGMPYGFLCVGRKGRAAERATFHRAERRVGKITVGDAINEMLQDLELDYIAYNDFYDTMYGDSYEYEDYYENEIPQFVCACCGHRQSA